MWFSYVFLKTSNKIRLPFREIATASPLAMHRNDIKYFVRIKNQQKAPVWVLKFNSLKTARI